MNRTMTMLAVALLAGLTTLPTGQSDVVPGLIERGCDVTDRMLAGEGCTVEPYEPCPPGQTGIQVGAAADCLTVPGVGSCPDGETGVTIGGKETCREGPSYCFKCEPGGGTGSEEGPKDPNCARSEDDVGVGGTHVTCRYACWAFNELGIGVVAMDTDAGTYGNTSCGGQDAFCNQPAPACVGVSPGLTSRREQDQRCDGHSDEINSSPTSVYCVAVGAGPAQQALCNINEILCDAGGSSTSSSATVGASPFEACTREGLDPSTIDTLQTVSGLIPIDAHEVSFVVFTFDNLVGEALRYEATAAGSWCTFEEFLL